MSRRRRNKTRTEDPTGTSWGSTYPTLDLHGQTAEEAERSAERWLHDRHDDGEPVVRLVTGRGLRSSGLPVLPGVIEGLLLRLSGTIVKSHQREQGGGAFRIQLVLPRLRLPDPAARKARLDPELVRAAEHALADLGIEPTPLLIEIEARRIVKERDGEAH